MGKEQGTNVLVYVNEGTGSPTNFVLVAGQKTGRLNLAPEVDDTTDKGNAGWGTELQVLVRGEVTLTGQVDWPDTNGFDQIRSAVENRTQIEIQIVLNAAGSKYTGLATVSAFDVGGDYNTVTNYNITLRSSDVWTYAAS